jgi:hypothetical protein
MLTPGARPARQDPHRHARYLVYRAFRSIAPHFVPPSLRFVAEWLRGRASRASAERRPSAGRRLSLGGGSGVENGGAPRAPRRAAAMFLDALHGGPHGGCGTEDSDGGSGDVGVVAVEDVGAGAGVGKGAGAGSGHCSSEERGGAAAGGASGPSAAAAGGAAAGARPPSRAWREAWPSAPGGPTPPAAVMTTVEAPEHEPPEGRPAGEPAARRPEDALEFAGEVGGDGGARSMVREPGQLPVSTEEPAGEGEEGASALAAARQSAVYEVYARCALQVRARDAKGGCGAPELE